MGTLALPVSGRVYIDANAVIYAIERIEPYRTLLEPLWNVAATGAVVVMTSELTWLETLTKPLRDHDTQREALFRAFLTAQEVTLLPTTLMLWEAAARLRGLGLKTPDALHAATALEQHCALFITNDPIFKRVPNLPVVILNEVANS